MHRRPDTSDILLGAAVGAVAGGLAAYAMNAFQSAWLQVDKPGEPDDEEAQDESGKAGQEDQEDQSDPATVATAEAVARPVLGRSLRPEEKAVAGPTVHYGFGILLGAVYGAIAEVEPRVTSAGGTLYGAGTWAAVDESLLPMTGIAGDPTDYPASIHIYGFVSHVVFGGALELARRGLRRIFR